MTATSMKTWVLSLFFCFFFIPLYEEMGSSLPFFYAGDWTGWRSTCWGSRYQVCFLSVCVSPIAHSPIALKSSLRFCVWRERSKKRLVFPGKPAKKKKKNKKTKKEKNLSKLGASPEDEKPSLEPARTEGQEDGEVERTIRKSTRTAVIVRQAERDAIRAALQATMKASCDYTLFLWQYLWLSCLISNLPPESLHMLTGTLGTIDYGLSYDDHYFPPCNVTIKLGSTLFS